MLSWKINNNVISELHHNGANIINCWGAETADSSAFYSKEDGYGYRYVLLNEESNKTKKKFNSFSHVRMFEGEWLLKSKSSLNFNSINRKLHLECLEDSYFMDFVMRFRFKKSVVKSVFINNIEYFHKNTNIYYQYPVDYVLINGINFKAKIQIVDSLIPDGMRRFMYVRDNGNDWIIHVRMLPERCDKCVIKLCNNWYKTRPIPQSLANLLLTSDIIKNNLWYRGERSKFKTKILRFINPAAFPIIKLKKGTNLFWNVNLTLDDIEK